MYIEENKSAKVLLYSVDFDGIERYQANGEWDKSADVLFSDVRRLACLFNKRMCEG